MAREPGQDEQRPALNDRAAELFQTLARRAFELQVVEHSVAEARVIDAGARVNGGLEAGLELARLCLSGLGSVSLVPWEVAGRAGLGVQVWTDRPVTACLRSQYAGWQLIAGKFFAMGSGPMRAAAGKEPLFAKVGGVEKPGQVVGVLECRKLPPEEAVLQIASACGVEPGSVMLAFAPTASLAGNLQVVARSVETCLHKLAELGFDLERIRSGHGVAPLPPVARDDLAGIGRTNDAILYGARVVLHVTGDDESLAEIGPQIPSCSSGDHGAPFAEIFERYNHDFYAVDPHLFSPAQVQFQNLTTGRVHQFGREEPAVMARSFFE